MGGVVLGEGAVGRLWRLMDLGGSRGADDVYGDDTSEQEENEEWPRRLSPVFWSEEDFLCCHPEIVSSDQLFYRWVRRR